MFPHELHSKIKKSAIIAVLVIDDARNAVPLAKALLRGGIDSMELTLRTDAAIASLKAIRDEVPEMLAGIGTILTTQQVDEVVAAGAAFGVAPGMNRRIVEYAISKGLPFGPGIATPSDIEQGIELGCKTLKFFPAESSGGLSHLKGMAAPYLHTGIDFIPLGGLNAGNAGNYLESPLVSAIGGSWIASRDLIAAQDWDAIEANAREARSVADAAGR
ncbi:MAG: bifunctional 4-hydroxy-2-oxoglutarate aldolase/2-dehydro-3-deoxy-phosphogluconate aldolase [Verrucomicrobiota bacterium]